MNPLAHVRDTTGRIIRLGIFDEVRDMRADDNEIVLSISTARFKELRGPSYRITHRGIILYRFLRDPRTEVWTRVETIPVWWSSDETHGQPSRSRDDEWEQMCYRPGTSRNPLDSPLRKNQGY